MAAYPRFTWEFSGGSWGLNDAELKLHYRSEARNYYAADGKLRYHQVNRDSVDHTGSTPVAEGDWGAYEEYWYDALGRRVLKRSHQDLPLCEWSLSFNRCHSAIERYVWDGDQIPWELRQNDAVDTKNPGAAGLTGQTGEIGYMHAGGIDAPVGMVKNGITVALHRNWRGLYAFGTDADGDQTTCAPDWFSGCDNIPWPLPCASDPRDGPGRRFLCRAEGSPRADGPLPRFLTRIGRYWRHLQEPSERPGPCHPLGALQAILQVAFHRHRSTASTLLLGTMAGSL